MSMKITGLDAALEQAAKAADPNRLDAKCRKAVKAGAETIREAFRQHLAGQNVSGRSSHQLENSFRVDPVKYDPGTGYYTKVHPDGYDAHGQAFDKIANVLEYGRASGKGRYPWRQPTVDREKTNVQAAITDTFKNTE